MSGVFPIRKGATHKVVIGPAVAVGDGFTPVTNLSLSTADEAEVILHDNGTVVDISGYTFAAITTADGYYHLTLQTGITNTVGHMTVVVQDDSLCLPLRADFVVMDTEPYDALYSTTSTLLTQQDAGMMYKSTVSTVTSQTQYDMADAFATDDVGIGNVVTIEDAGDSTNFHSTWISDLDQVNERIIVNDAPPWTVQTSDIVRVYAHAHPGYHSNAQIANASLATSDFLLALFQLALRKDAAIRTDRSTELGQINTDEGSGAGTYDNLTDSQEKANVASVLGNDLSEDAADNNRKVGY